MACYVFSVLTSWLSSVYCGAGSETALSKQSEQVVMASSMIPMDFNDISSRQETSVNVPESCQESSWKGGDTAKVIIIRVPTETAYYIMGQAHSACVSTSSIMDMEDTSICDGGAICTLTETLEKLYTRANLRWWTFRRGRVRQSCQQHTFVSKHITFEICWEKFVQ
jgi:hypothetical protein